MRKSTLTSLTWTTVAGVIAAAMLLGAIDLRRAERADAATQSRLLQLRVGNFQVATETSASRPPASSATHRVTAVLLPSR